MHNETRRKIFDQAKFSYVRTKFSMFGHNDRTMCKGYIWLWYYGFNGSINYTCIYDYGQCQLNPLYSLAMMFNIVSIGQPLPHNVCKTEA